MKQLLILFAVALLTTGCAQTPISANPLQDLQGSLGKGEGTASIIVTDLQNQSWNLQEAMSVGALPSTDQAAGCVNSFLTEVGITVPSITPPVAGAPVAPATVAAPSFIPKVTGVFSESAVLYIRAQQLKALAASGGLTTTSTACDTMIVNFEKDALKAGVSVLPGSSLLAPITGAL